MLCLYRQGIQIHTGDLHFTIICYKFPINWWLLGATIFRKQKRKNYSFFPVSINIRHTDTETSGCMFVHVFISINNSHKSAFIDEFWLWDGQTWWYDIFIKKYKCVEKLQEKDAPSFIFHDFCIIIWDSKYKCVCVCMHCKVIRIHIKS